MRKNTILPCGCGAAVSLLVAGSDDDDIRCYYISSTSQRPRRWWFGITPWSVIPGIQVFFYKKAFIKHRIRFGMRVNLNV